jgi:TolB protein
MKIIVQMLALFTLICAALLTLARRADSGWVVFASNREGEDAIYLMTGDGASVRKVTPDHYCGTRPNWSPDGRWIAFFAGDCGGSSLHLQRIRPNGADLQSLTRDDLFPRDAHWSPDGARLLVTGRASDMLIVDILTGDARPLATGYELPVWSPDGVWIYARARSREDHRMDRIHVETGRIEGVLTSQGWFSYPGLSPRGEHIAVGMERDDGDELFLMSADGATLTAITTDLPPPRIFEPHWSPDGEWIAFLAGRLPPIALWVYRVRPDGSQLQRLTEDAGLQFNLQWSPDSEWLLFSANYDDRSNIFRLHADGSGMENITPQPGNDFFPEYAPVAGLDWRPIWLMIAAAGMFVGSLMRRFRW